MLVKVKKWKDVTRVALLGLISTTVVSWGIYGHEHINHAAVLALPKPLQLFFYNHIDFIRQESTVPDLRKYTLNDREERPRHYINLESYGFPDSLSKSWDVTQKKFSKDMMAKSGTLPWYMQTMMQKLTQAFKEKRKTEILFLAGDLGHYMGDAHMPLHTCRNHDGDETNQRGIHAFWEGQLPDQFGDGYSFKTDTASYVADIEKRIWDIIFDSYHLADTLLLTDKQLTKEFAADKIYELDKQGQVLKNKFGSPVHSHEYARQYHTRLKGMVEKQMRKAIKATADFWYTAWVNAGKPDLSDLDPKEQTERNAGALKQDLKLWKEGKIRDVKSEREF